MDTDFEGSRFEVEREQSEPDSELSIEEVFSISSDAIVSQVHNRPILGKK